MRKRALTILLALLAGLSAATGAHAGLNFGWLTASPIAVGSDINLGSAAVGSELNSGVQTLTASTQGSVSAVRIDSIEITGNPAQSDYSGTCVPGLELGHGASCTIQFAVRSGAPVDYSEQVNIGCSPVQAIGVSTVLCAPSSVHFFHNLLAEFFSVASVPAMSSEAFTLMCLLILATGGYFGFRRN